MARTLGVMLALLMLAACGKKGDPEPPNPNNTTWPRPPVVREAPR